MVLGPFDRGAPRTALFVSLSPVSRSATGPPLPDRLSRGAADHPLSARLDPPSAERRGGDAPAGSSFRSLPRHSSRLSGVRRGDNPRRRVSLAPQRLSSTRLAAPS